MRKKLLIIIPAAVLLLCAAAAGIFYAIEGYGGLFRLFGPSVDQAGIMQPGVYISPGGAALPYRIYVPEDYDEHVFPLVVFLHGAGERGDDNLAQIGKNSITQVLLSEENRLRFPCIVVAPQCPAEQNWAYNSELLMGLLEQVRNDYAVDPARIYVTGLSMGGHGAWAMLAQYPDYFAAAVPACGWGDPESAGLIRDIPIWAFHGGRDTVVRPAGSRNIVEALRSIGGNIKYTEYPREGHQSWFLAWREPELFPWMFAQARG